VKNLNWAAQNLQLAACGSWVEHSWFNVLLIVFYTMYAVGLQDVKPVLPAFFICVKQRMGKNVHSFDESMIFYFAMYFNSG